MPFFSSTFKLTTTAVITVIMTPEEIGSNFCNPNCFLILPIFILHTFDFICQKVSTLAVEFELLWAGLFIQAASWSAASQHGGPGVRSESVAPG